MQVPFPGILQGPFDDVDRVRSVFTRRKPGLKRREHPIPEEAGHQTPVEGAGQHLEGAFHQGNGAAILNRGVARFGHGIDVP